MTPSEIPYRSRLGRRNGDGKVTYLRDPRRRWSITRFLAGAYLILLTIGVLAAVVALVVFAVGLAVWACRAAGQ